VGDVVGRNLKSHSLASQVQRLLRDNGALTKRELVDITGASRTTVSSVVADLMEAGEIEASASAVSTGGRRSAALRLASRVSYRGLALGSTRCRAAVVDGALDVAEVVGAGGGLADDPETVFGTLVDLATAPGPPPRAIGLAVSGDLEYDDVEPVSVRTGTRMWNLRDLKERLYRATGVPVALMAAGEALASGTAVKGTSGDRVAVVARLGATIAAVTVVEGDVLRGATGAAGVVGHLKVEEFGPSCTCGRSGCLDSFAGIPAVLSQAGAAAVSGRSSFLETRASSGGPVHLSDLVDAVHAGDPVSVQLARDVGRRVGEGLAAAVAIAAPTTIVLSGPLVGLGDELVSEIRAAVYRQAPAAATRALVLRPGHDGERCLLAGAARIASELVH
jgi:predicted NBD/HSP70 family sugar kinase